MHQLWLVLHEKINPWIYNSICNFGQFRMPVQTKVCFKNNLFTIGFLKIRNSKNRILKRFQKIWISSWNTAQSGIPGRSWDQVVRFGARQFEIMELWADSKSLKKTMFSSCDIYWHVMWLCLKMILVEDFLFDPSILEDHKVKFNLIYFV